MAEYVNPWHRKGGLYGPPAYSTTAEPKDYRGFMIYRRLPDTWDVVKDGVCLSQRAGLSGARRAIDNLIDSPTDFCAIRMAEYLAKHSAAT